MASFGTLHSQSLSLPAGTSPSLSPVNSPSNPSPAVGSSLASRSAPVEFPDTADFLTKPSITLHKPLAYTLSSPDFQQHLRCPSFCARCCPLAPYRCTFCFPGPGLWPLTLTQPNTVNLSANTPYCS